MSEVKTKLQGLLGSAVTVNDRELNSLLYKMASKDFLTTNQSYKACDKGIEKIRKLMDGISVYFHVEAKQSGNSLVTYKLLKWKEIKERYGRQKERSNKTA